MRHAWRLCGLGFFILSTSLTGQAPGDSAKASALRDQGAYLGPFLGFVVSTVSGQGVEGFNNRSDFSIGLQADMIFRGGAFIRTGGFYTGRGATLSDSGSTVAIKERYLEAPLLAGYRFEVHGHSRVLVFGGIQGAIRASCEVSESGVSGSVNCDNVEGLRFTSADLAFVSGVGFSLAVGRANLVFDVRYVIGQDAIVEYSDAKNRGVTIGGAYMFPLASAK